MRGTMKFVMVGLILRGLFNKDIGWAFKTPDQVFRANAPIQSYKLKLKRDASMRPCRNKHNSKRNKTENVEEFKAALIPQEPVTSNGNVNGMHDASTSL